MDYASRWARFFAAVIDGIVLTIIAVILATLGVFGDMVEPPGYYSSTLLNAAFLGVFVLAYYFVLTVAFGATLGKMALGMRVVGADGEKVGAGAVVTREVVGRAGPYIVQAVLFVVFRAAFSDGAALFIAQVAGLLVFLVIFLRILVDDHRQGWHDKIGGTFVVKAR